MSPGWCSPATCPSSMRKRSTRCSLARDPASTPPRSAPATTACPSRCAPSTSRARAQAIAAQIAAGRNCPRKFLINAHTQLLDQPNPRALDNVNTVEEYERAMSALDACTERAMPNVTIRVQYYALLREQAGRSDETADHGRARCRASCTPSCARVIRSRCRRRCCAWPSTPNSANGRSRLKAGDAVVFIPPVAGG